MDNKNNKKLFVISGSSGVGKGTIIRGFLDKHPEFKFSVSYTTRPIREGEVDGVNYFFVSKAEFERNINKKEFLEWAEFSDNYYGTSRSFVEKTLSEGNDLILEIETQGALQIKRKMPEAVLIFIAPPSYQDLEFRLRSRNTENEEAITKRLEFVKLEIENSQYYDYKITNDKVENAIAELEKIVKIERAY